MQYLLRNKIVIATFLVCFCTQLQAQRGELFQPDHDFDNYWLGISLGYSNSFLGYTRNTAFLAENVQPGQVATIYANTDPYYNLGLSATIRIKNHLLARVNPTLLLGQRTIIDYHTQNIDGTISNAKSLSVSSNILHIPLSIKLESDRYDFMKFSNLMRHYVFFGAKFDYDFTNGAAKENDATSSTSLTLNSIFNKSDVGLEAGLGLSFFLRYATISPEVKFGYGLTDMRKTGNNIPLLGSLENVRANYISFTIHIEN